MACHNGQQGRGGPGREYAIWAAHGPDGQALDKHSQAYGVLLTGGAAAMARNLGRGKKAHEDSLCLNCHVVPAYESYQVRGLLPRNFQTDGVSCESCHGPAQKWLAEHHRAAWKTTSRAAKAELGWRDTRTLSGRARSCVPCHVGSAGRAAELGQDVSHDLYAAGHPPLVFEFAAFHAATPHHWQDARDKDARLGGRPDFEARAWLIGQVVSAQAALDLLADRAGSGEKPWPEFAEHDCASCHHNLRASSSAPARAPKSAGLPWRSWYFHMLPRAAQVLAGKPDTELDQLLKNVQRALEERRPPRDKLKGLAGQASRRLQAHLDFWDKAEVLDFNLERLYQDILREEANRLASWDDAAQTYLALAALHHAWSDLGKTPDSARQLAPLLQKWAGQLRLGRDYRGPHAFDPKSTMDLLDPFRRKVLP